MKYYVVDAFTEELFRGNPAGVCMLDAWPDDAVLQGIAFENNLSETAFLVKRDGFYALRWFTPTTEIELCGHATLASAYVIFHFYEPDALELVFMTQSGRMAAVREGELIYLDFPARPVEKTVRREIFDEALGCKAFEVQKAVDYLVVLENAHAVRELRPDFSTLGNVRENEESANSGFGVIVTAKGEDCDFVSRFFAPNLGIDEDPVTGRAHCTLIPFWAEKLGKTKLAARQLSLRGGTLYCENAGERVRIGGKAVCYLIGDIQLP